MAGPPVIEVVEYGGGEWGHPWYARVTYPDGLTYHRGPWRTEWAAGESARWVVGYLERLRRHRQ